jgi:hypothetical protein
MSEPYQSKKQNENALVSVSTMRSVNVVSSYPQSVRASCGMRQVEPTTSYRDMRSDRAVVRNAMRQVEPTFFHWPDSPVSNCLSTAITGVGKTIRQVEPTFYRWPYSRISNCLTTSASQEDGSRLLQKFREEDPTKKKDVTLLLKFSEDLD